MYKNALRCCLLLFLSTQFSNWIAAQSISGMLRTEAGEPAEFATVKLLRSADSTVVAGAVANAGGSFDFQNIVEGDYRIQCALIGHADIFSPVISIKKGDAVALDPLGFVADNLLRETVVTARLPVIERQIDKVVVNVEGSTLAAGNNVLELLQRSPGVLITPQGAVMLEGKSGVMVMVDGKPSQLSGDQLIAFLQSMPAETVSKIELIARPSSKYDAEGVSGIINIRLKKNQNLGLNGTFSAGYTQGIHARLRTGLNLNYRPGKINVFGNTNLVEGAQSVGQTIQRFAAGKVFDQTNPMVEQFGTQSFKAGVDFFAHERHTLGVLVLGNFYHNDSRKDNLTLIRNEGSALIDSTLRSRILAPTSNDRLTFNVNYRFADTSGNELTFDADRIVFRSTGSNTLENRRFDSENVLLTNDALRSDIGSDIMVWSFKTDYVKNTKKGLKLEAGTKINRTNSNNDIQSTREADGVSQPDASRTNLFDYRENIAAAYTNIGKQGSKFNWQLGLRAERTEVKGASTDLYGDVLNNPDTAYAGLFPTAYLQYTLKTMHQLGFSYNRRLSRPAYQDMNPFVWQIDPYTSERGNPYLRPAYTHSTELTYTYKYAASVSIGFSQTTDLVNTIARQEGDQAYTQPRNIRQQDNISLNINMPLPLKSWWEGYLWLGVWHNQFKSQLDEGQLDAGAFGGGCYLSQQFNLGKGYEMEASFWAQFPTQDGIFTNRGIASVSAGARKSFWQNKAIVKLAVNDLFGTQRWTQSADFGSVRGTMRNTWESRNIALSFSWKFGNQNLKTRNRNNGGATDADERIKARKE